MALEVFEIERYSVGHGRSASEPTSVITARGKSEISGNDVWAQLLFSPASSGLSGQVENIGVSSLVVRIFAELPDEDFPRMYDILRNEAPARLWSEYGEGTTATRPLNFVGILTNSNEIPGEGPADADSVKQFILAFQDLPD